MSKWTATLTEMSAPSNNTAIAFRAVEEPSSRNRVSPFVVCFSSGFQPEAQDGFKWEINVTNSPRPDHLIVGRAVSPNNKQNPHRPS